MKKIIYAIAILMAVGCNKAADTVVLGTIRTAEEDNPVVEAIAVKDGKFIYVGDKAGAEAYIKEGVTEVIDHTGKGMVMPSCFDGHAHYLIPMTLANMKGGVLFAHGDGKAEILKKVDAAALEAANAGKKCLFGFGWDFYTLMMTGSDSRITLAELDAVSHGVSVALFDSGGHNMFCNSECFRRSGIIDDKGNVLIKKIEGGLLELDENGHLTGFIDERVTGYPMRMGGMDPDEILDEEVASIALEKTQELLLSTGYVSYMEGWSNTYHPSRFYEVANRFDKEGRLKLLLSMSYEVEPWQKDMSEQIDYLVSLREKYGTSHVRPEYLKVFMDGCVETTTGSMFKPYKNGVVYNSHWPVDRLADITRECNAKGITVHTHTMGDKAIAEVTDAYIKGGDGVHRNCLVHIRNPRKEDFKRFAENNIACTAGITWHVGDELAEAVLPEYIDIDYVKSAYPIKSFFDAGVKVSSHSDYPANGICPQDPFGIMEVALTGKMTNPSTGKPTPVFDAEELITLDQALQALTINGAWQLGLENERGSIKVGKYADFVLADQDVFDCPVTDIHKTKVVSTWFEGEKVYQAEMTKIADYLYEYEADDYGSEAPAAVCENGQFVGYVEDNEVLTFKGIPFAKAPVGELRWKAPQPVEASDKVFEAKVNGLPGLQSYDEGEVASHGDLSEDCLYLNVWTKDLQMTKDRPVMVWFHGGSYGWGGTVDPLYEGKYLVAEYPDVVLVSVEYRVNAMGFIDFVDVPGGEAFPDAPYLGILDQQQALRWIQKNISAFGGDPDNVTIFGESAGGGSVSCHLIAKGSEGLFRRAIPMSGEICLEHTPENYKATGQAAKLLAATGCKDMDGLMALSEEDILKALNTEAGGVSAEGVGGHVGDYNNWPMRSDERSIIPSDGYKAILGGKSKDVDVMIGVVADEIRYWAHLQYDPTDEVSPLAYYYEWAKEKVDGIKKIGGPETARRIDESLRIIDPDSDEWDAKHPGIWKYTHILSDYNFRLGSITIAQNHSEAGGKGKTYMYVFGKGYEKGSTHGEDYMKACHACELTYAFNNLVYEDGAPFDPVLTKRFSNIFVNFARTGNPSIEGLEIPEYEKTERSTIIVGRDSQIYVEKNPLPRETGLLLPTYYDFFLKK